MSANKNDPFTLAVPDSPEYRHRYERSGIGIGDKEEDPDYKGEKRDSRKLYQSDMDELVAASIDPERIEGGQITPGGIKGPKGRDTEKIQIPTRKDIETVFQTDQEFEDALDREDAEYIQKRVFTADVSDKDVNSFIDMFDKEGDDNKALVNKFKTSGLGEGRDRAAYSGKIFDGPVPEKYRAKTKKDGKWVVDESIEDDDIVDLVALKKDFPELYTQALNNRGFEGVRTYLKQRGVDGYAPHEGRRSIGDMDLEHIRALKSEQPDGINGRDHPSNWMWGQRAANRRRGDTPLTTRTQDYAIGPETVSYDKGAVMQSFNDFIGSVLGEKPKGAAGREWEEMKKALVDDLGGKPTTSGGSGMFGVSTIQDRSKKDRATEKKRLMKMGASEEQAEGMLGNVERGYDETAAVNKPFKYGAQARMDGRPLAGNPNYDEDVLTYMRDHRMYRKGTNLLRQIPQLANLSDDELKNTPEFRQLTRGLRQLSRLGADAPKPQEKPEVADDAAI